MSEPPRNHTDHNLQEIVFFNDVIEILFYRSVASLTFPASYSLMFFYLADTKYYLCQSLEAFSTQQYFSLKKNNSFICLILFFSLTCASAWLCFIEVATFHVACWKSPFHVGSEMCHQKSISRAHTECLLTNTLVVQISVTLDSMRVKRSRVKNTLT